MEHYFSAYIWAVESIWYTVPFAVMYLASFHFCVELKDVEEVVGMCNSGRPERLSQCYNLKVCSIIHLSAKHWLNMVTAYGMAVSASSIFMSLQGHSLFKIALPLEQSCYPNGLLDTVGGPIQHFNLVKPLKSYTVWFLLCLTYPKFRLF